MSEVKDTTKPNPSSGKGGHSGVQPVVHPAPDPQPDQSGQWQPNLPNPPLQPNTGKTTVKQPKPDF